MQARGAHLYAFQKPSMSRRIYEWERVAFVPTHKSISPNLFKSRSTGGERWRAALATSLRAYSKTRQGFWMVLSALFLSKALSTVFEG
jgi:hypothetical protein